MPGGEERGQPWVSPLSTRSTASTAPSTLPAPSYDPHVSRCSPRSSSFSTQSCRTVRFQHTGAASSSVHSSGPHTQARLRRRVFVRPRVQRRATSDERGAQKNPCHARTPSRLPEAAVRVRTSVRSRALVLMHPISRLRSPACDLPPPASHLPFSSPLFLPSSPLFLTHDSICFRCSPLGRRRHCCVSPHPDSDSSSGHGERVHDH